MHSSHNWALLYHDSPEESDGGPSEEWGGEGARLSNSTPSLTLRQPTCPIIRREEEITLRTHALVNSESLRLLLPILQLFDTKWQRHIYLLVLRNTLFKENAETSKKGS